MKRERERRIYYGSWLTSLWRLGRFRTCCLQAGDPGKWWYNLFLVQRPENWRNPGLSSRVQRLNLEFQCPRVGEDGCPSSRRDRKFVPLYFFILFRLDWLDETQPHWWKQIFFTQPTGLNVNLFEKHPLRHTEIMYYQWSGHPLAQASWYIKLSSTLRDELLLLQKNRRHSFILQIKNEKQTN